MATIYYQAFLEYVFGMLNSNAVLSGIYFLVFHTKWTDYMHDGDAASVRLFVSYWNYLLKFGIGVLHLRLLGMSV